MLRAGDNSEDVSTKLGKTLLQSYSPFLAKFSRLLPAKDQATLQAFSDELRRPQASAIQLVRLYRLLQRDGLHRYLTIHALQRLLRRVSGVSSISQAESDDEHPSNIVIGLIDDYNSLGFMLGISEYSSLVRALAQEVGREQDALRVLDSVIEESEIGPFLRHHKKSPGHPVSAADRIPSDEEIARIEESLKDTEQPGAIDTQQAPDEPEDPDPESLREPGDIDRIQALVIESRQAWLKHHLNQASHRRLQISREFYHMAMRGFAQIYHVRGVLAILNRMLETATYVPHRIARYLMPNKDTWDIVGEVLVRQRDRPSFVKVWIDFLSRGARPPIVLTRRLVRLLVRQMHMEQAVWVMRISRCLPDFGDSLPKAAHTADEVPWDLKVQTMYVASALEAATALDVVQMTRADALQQGRTAAQLPLLSKPDPGMYGYLIGGAVRAKSGRLAEHLFQELVDAGLAPTGATYGQLASMYADQGQISRVFLIVRNMLVRSHQYIAQQRIAQGTLTTSMDQKKYKAIVVRRAAMLEGDVDCIVPLLRFYIEENREHEALALLRSWDMVYQNYVPADKLVLALLKVYERPQDALMAEQLVHRLASELAKERDAASTSAEPQQDPAVTVAKGANAHVLTRIHMQAIRTHLQARDIPGILRVLRKVAANGMTPPYSMWDEVMRGLLREQALDLFDAVHAFLRDTLRVPLSLPLYSLWMQSLRNHGDLAGVQAAFDEMVELGQIPTQQHYLLLVQAYAYSGLVEQAVSIVNNLRKPRSALRPGLGLDIAVIEAYVVSGETERADAELRRLLQTTHLPVNKIPARPFNHIIVGHLYAGQGREAMNTYEEMVRIGVRPDVYTFAILMHSYASAGDLHSCTRVFNEMVRVGISPDLVIYTILICAFGAVGRVTNAEMTFKQVLQEQEWARERLAASAGHRSDAGLSAGSADALGIYAEKLEDIDMSGTLGALDSGRATAEENFRLRCFYNLDPVVYIAMLSVYRTGRRTLSALATWERLIQNFPVVQWNPRQGGINSKSLYYTGSFHQPAWTLLLRTVKRSIGITNNVMPVRGLARHFYEPLYPESISDAMGQRLRHKQALARLAAESPDNKDVANAVRRMKDRIRNVHDIEAELDRRLVADHDFCGQERMATATPGLVNQGAFVDFGYWMPRGVDLPIQVSNLEGRSTDHSRGPGDDAAAHKAPAAAPAPPFFDKKDSQPTTDTTARGIAAILARQWRFLEERRFKFQNTHVAEYIPCMLLGRRYEDLRRFLSLAEPGSATSKKDADTHYRYRNVAIPRHLSIMLAQQLTIVRKQLLVERERRILLAALLGNDRELQARYISQSVYGSIDSWRTDDELQVIRERLTVHHERELAWSTELQTLVEIARLWSDRLKEGSGSQLFVKNEQRKVLKGLAL
ncbi:hypothetical protein GGF46_002776 [Coemansia sp. RSA 552]|nr:hypothetical protein GGF46_002776 [Coemansia sp. RSA 552]